MMKRMLFSEKGNVFLFITAVHQRTGVCVHGHYAPELCFYLFSWSWLILRVSHDFNDCDEFKWQCLLNKSLQPVCANYYYKTLRTGAVDDDESIDIKTIFCLSLFLRISQRGGHRLLCCTIKQLTAPLDSPRIDVWGATAEISPEWWTLMPDYSCKRIILHKLLSRHSIIVIYYFSRHRV